MINPAFFLHYPAPRGVGCQVVRLGRGKGGLLRPRGRQNIYTTLYGGCSFIAFLFSLRSIVSPPLSIQSFFFPNCTALVSSLWSGQPSLWGDIYAAIEIWGQLRFGGGGREFGWDEEARASGLGGGSTYLTAKVLLARLSVSQVENEICCLGAGLWIFFLFSLICGFDVGGGGCFSIFSPPLWMRFGEAGRER